jgi:hypothetical protein
MRDKGARPRDVTTPQRGSPVEGASQRRKPVGGLAAHHADVGEEDIDAEPSADNGADQVWHRVAGGRVVPDPPGHRGVVVAQPDRAAGDIELFRQAGARQAGALDQRGQKQVRLGHLCSVGPHEP